MALGILSTCYWIAPHKNCIKKKGYVSALTNSLGNYSNMKTDNQANQLIQISIALSMLMLAACGDRSGTYTQGTSEQEQAYRDLGGALHSELQRRGRMMLKIVETKGSLDNVQRLQNGELDFALVQGGFEFDDTGLLMLAAVDTEHLHIVVPVSSDSHDLSDLAGKRIAAGVAGTGSRRLTESIVDAASYDPPVELIPTSRETAAAEMERGEVDAAMFVSDLRRELKPLLAEGQFRLVGVKTAEALSQLLFDVNATEIPAGIYGRNLSLPDAPLPTLSVQTNLIVRADVSNNIVKQMIEALYNFRVRYDAWLPHLTEESGSSGPDLMLHPAAEAYYQRNDPLTSDQFEIAAFFLAALIALISAVRLVWRWYRIRVITGNRASRESD